jgi:hypothetical protein
MAMPLYESEDPRYTASGALHVRAGEGPTTWFSGDTYTIKASGDRSQSDLTQTHKPTAHTQKACKYRPFSKRLKGFEPSTFCMASRTCCADSRGISLQTGRVFGTDAQIGFPGIYREFTGVWVVNG